MLNDSGTVELFEGELATPICAGSASFSELGCGSLSNSLVRARAVSLTKVRMDLSVVARGHVDKFTFEKGIRVAPQPLVIVCGSISCPPFPIEHGRTKTWSARLDFAT